MLKRILGKQLEGMDWIYLAQDEKQSLVVVSTAMKLRIHKKTGNFFTNWFDAFRASGTLLQCVGYVSAFVRTCFAPDWPPFVFSSRTVYRRYRVNSSETILMRLQFFRSWSLICASLSILLITEFCETSYKWKQSYCKHYLSVFFVNIVSSIFFTGLL
jgi:hypothetical protein